MYDMACLVCVSEENFWRSGRHVILLLQQQNLISFSLKALFIARALCRCLFEELLLSCVFPPPPPLSLSCLQILEQAVEDMQKDLVKIRQSYAEVRVFATVPRDYYGCVCMHGLQ